MVLTYAKSMLRKSAVVAFCLSAALSALPAFAADDEMSEEEKAAQMAAVRAANEEYLRNIQPVHFPPVPFGWNLVIGNNAVSYIHTGGKGDAQGKKTVIKMRYTRKTNRLNAEAYIDNYIGTHGCSEKTKAGTGFYTASCRNNNTFVTVIGEVDNMYIIELTGTYSAAASAILENYVNAIISGKRVFADRNIGDLTDRQ